VARDFLVSHNVQTGSGAHPASYPVGTIGSFPGRAVDHSPSYSAEIKNGGAIPPLPIDFYGTTVRLPLNCNINVGNFPVELLPFVNSN
jgi:hypothetical protein